MSQTADNAAGRAEAPIPERSDATDDAPPQAGAIVSVSSFVGRLRWPIFCLFQLGVIAGFVVTSFRSVPVASSVGVPNPRATVQSDYARARTPRIEEFPVAVLDRGDQLVRAGRFENALATYRSLIVADCGEIPSLLRYRIAVCLEQLGRWDPAIAEFASVGSGNANSTLAVAAQLGQARVWMRKGRSAEAKDLICDLLLRSGIPEFRGNALLGETVHRLARLMALDCIGADVPGPIHEWAPARAANEATPGGALAWIASVGPQVDSADANDTNSIQVENPHGPVEQMLVRGDLDRIPVSEALQKIAAASGRHCLMTPQAQQLAANRTTAVVVDSLPLITVIAAIAEPLGLLWDLTDADLHFCSDQEVTDNALRRYRELLAERALTNAVQRYSDNNLVDYAQFELGNLAYSRGKFAESAEVYKRLAIKSPRSAVAIEASYNLGLALRQMGQNDAARVALYRVVDGSPTHALAPLACLTIGRMYLDEAEFAKAIAPLRRAAAIGAGTDTVPASVLLLAATHILMDHTDVASAILVEQRDRITEAPYRTVAAFLESYSRMLSSGGRRQAQREGRVLTWAILGAGRDSVLGPCGVILMGHAYRELGLGEKMIELYQKALRSGVPPALQPEMSYDTAEYSHSIGDLADAIERFTALANQSNGVWSRAARIRLAEIALDDGRPEDCFLWCRSLLDTSNARDTATVLKLLGRAFDQAGAPQKAALCFAGQLPEF